jgi:hypothetical protein
VPSYTRTGKLASIFRKLATRAVGEILALLTGTDATMTGQQATAAGGPDPGSSRDGKLAEAEQVRATGRDEAGT